MSKRRRLRVQKSHRRRRLIVLRLAVLGLLSIAVGVVTAFTATNNVQASRATDKTHTIVVADLTPANCTGANVGNVTFYRIVGPGTVNIKVDAGHGGDTNQIWLGTTARNNMAGGGGNDCMVPGGNTAAQNETVAGGAGTDYCYRGPGPGGYTLNANCEFGGSTGPYTTRTSGPF